MKKPEFSLERNGTLVLQIPSGRIKWTVGGTISMPKAASRTTLNAIAQFLRSKENTVGRVAAFRQLQDVLELFYPNWDTPAPSSLMPKITKDDFRVGDTVTAARRPYWGRGTVIEKLVKNVTVVFENRPRVRVRCSPSALTKV